MNYRAARSWGTQGGRTTALPQVHYPSSAGGEAPPMLHPSRG